MSSNVVVAALVRNEMSRFFPSALETWGTFAREIVVLDDASDDGTREHALSQGAVVRTRESREEAWGAESDARRELFEFAWDVARIDDFVLVLDADMTPARDPRPLTTSDSDAIAFTLYDLWQREPLAYRSDEFWRGHLVPRVWAARKKREHRDVRWTWNPRGIHTGHFPANLTFDRISFAPNDFALLHFAYVTPELREDKYVQYARVASALTDFERAHARSILDPSPSLVSLPYEPELVLSSVS